MPVDSGEAARPKIEAPQPAGIVERLVRDDSDRKRFLKMAGSAGAASFGAFVLAACGSSSSSSSSSTTAAAPARHDLASSANTTDIGILNYALTLEYLETEFYAKVIAAKLFSGSVGSLIKDLRRAGGHARGRAEAAAISSSAAPRWRRWKASSRSPPRPQTAELAYTVENLGAAAYLGQAPLIQSPQVLAAALSIHSVEARHAATHRHAGEKVDHPGWRICQAG